MITQSSINIITVIIVALISIHIAGMFIYKNDNADVKNKNPLFQALGFGFSGLGAGILLMILEAYLLPAHIRNEIINIRTNHSKK